MSKIRRDGRRTSGKGVTDEEIIYNESCLFTLLNVSVSMEAFFTMVMAFYANWHSSRTPELGEERRRVIMLGTPLLYKKHFVNS